MHESIGKNEAWSIDIIGGVIERLLDDFSVPEPGELRLNEPAIRRNREAKR